MRKPYKITRIKKQYIYQQLDYEVIRHTTRRRLGTGSILLAKGAILYPNIIIQSNGQNSILLIRKRALVYSNVFINMMGQAGVIVGEHAEIRHNTHIEIANQGKTARINLKLAKEVVLGVNNWLQCNGGIQIGPQTIIGPQVSIISTTHTHDDNRAYRESPLEPAQITIGQNNWIGSHVTILHGINIGDNNIIGAHSLVNQDIGSNSKIYGIPAKMHGSIAE